ncbi:MAG: hypothetical protein IJ190_02975, partial [Prevotella sp.]|nr:hypothetical protein [Prevotella sp.]
RKIVDSAIFRFLPSLRGGRDRGRGGAPPYGKEGTGEVEKLQHSLHKTRTLGNSLIKKDYCLIKKWALGEAPKRKKD